MSSVFGQPNVDPNMFATLNRYDSADKVSAWLTEHGYEHTREQAFVGLMGYYDYLKFDIYLPMYNVCIEVDGQQHYQAKHNLNKSIEDFLKKREYARRKEFYCTQHGMYLVRIVWDELPYLDRTLAFLQEMSPKPLQPNPQVAEINTRGEFGQPNEVVTGAYASSECFYPNLLIEE